MAKIITLIKSDTFIQFVKYGLVGVSGLVIELCIFYLLVKVFQVHYFFSPSLSSILGISTTSIDQSSSHVISSLIAIINNFILNSYFTFKVKNEKIKRFLKFFGIALVGLVVSTLLFNYLNNKLDSSWVMISKALAVLTVACLQFLFNKFFTFKQEKK